MNQDEKEKLLKELDKLYKKAKDKYEDTSYLEPRVSSHYYGKTQAFIEAYETVKSFMKG